MYAVQATGFPHEAPLESGESRADASIDENFSEKHHLWVRFGGTNVKRTGTDGTSSYDPTNGLYSTSQRLRNLVASYSWTVTLRILNELRGGYSVADVRAGYPLAAQGYAIYTAAGVKGLPAPPSSGGVPALIFLDGSFGTNNQDGRPEVTKNLTYNIGDAATTSIGRHAVKFGADYQHCHFQDFLNFTAGVFLLSGGTARCERQVARPHRHARHRADACRRDGRDVAGRGVAGPEREVGGTRQCVRLRSTRAGESPLRPM